VALTSVQRFSGAGYQSLSYSRLGTLLFIRVKWIIEPKQLQVARSGENYQQRHLTIAA